MLRTIPLQLRFHGGIEQHNAQSERHELQDFYEILGKIEDWGKC